MDRYLSCWKITGKCYYVALDPTEEGALKKLAEHVEEAHRMPLTEALREKAKSVMRLAA